MYYLTNFSQKNVVSRRKTCQENFRSKTFSWNTTNSPTKFVIFKLWKQWKLSTMSCENKRYNHMPQTCVRSNYSNADVAVLIPHL